MLRLPDPVDDGTTGSDTSGSPSLRVPEAREVDPKIIAFAHFKNEVGKCGFYGEIRLPQETGTVIVKSSYYFKLE